MNVKGILIDPPRLIVTPVIIENYTWRSIQKILDVRCFTLAGTHERDNNNNGLFVDDEGLMNGTQFAFECPFFYPELLAGRGLILGCDEEGATIDTNLRPAEIIQGMRWAFDQNFPTDSLPKESTLVLDFDNAEIFDGSVTDDQEFGVNAYV